MVEEPTRLPIDAADAVQGNGNEPRRSPVPSRNATVRARVRQLVASLGYEPTLGDLFGLTRWAHIYELWRRLGERLDAQGELKQDGEPKRLLGEWVRPSGELRALEASLGLTAAARAALGLDVAHGRALDMAAEHAGRGA